MKHLNARSGMPLLFAVLGSSAAITTSCSGPQPLHLAVRTVDEETYLAMFSEDDESPRDAFLRQRARQTERPLQEVMEADAAISAKQNPFDARHDASAVSRGAVIYKFNCMSCHGANVDGRGPNLAEPMPEMDFHSFSKRFAVTLHGGAPTKWFRIISEGTSSERLDAAGHPVVMEPFGEKLAREQIWLVITYLQSLDADIEDQPSQP